MIMLYVQMLLYVQMFVVFACLTNATYRLPQVEWFTTAVRFEIALLKHSRTAAVVFGFETNLCFYSVILKKKVFVFILYSVTPGLRLPSES